jgi:hypothetical protein
MFVGVKWERQDFGVRLVSTEDLKSTAKKQSFYHLTQSYVIILDSFAAGSMVLIGEACSSDLLCLCSLMFVVA